MADKNEIMKTFEAAVREVLNNPKLEVKPENTLFDDLGLESIDLLDLSCDLEKTLGREIDFKEVFKKVTVSQSIKANEVNVGQVVDCLASNA